MPQDHVSEFMQDELLSVQPRRTDGMQDYLDVVRGQPQAADRSTIQKFGSFDIYGPMPDAFDHFDESFQVQMGRKR
ncbi:hypothetical protein [Paenarthrobacter nitroguajacolicus]|uniref:hypothetical protein n=1 Tax=Paenarthrobacter nitroguajacolicus TaxID=211146 RepID=UPI004054472F